MLQYPTKERRAASFKKIQLDLLFSELPVLVPLLWIPRGSKKLDNINTVGKELEKPRNAPSDSEFLYISGNIHISSLLWDTTTILTKIIKCNGAVVYLVNEAKNELYVNPFIGDNQNNRTAWTIRSDSTAAAYAADQKKSLILNSLPQVEPFNGFDWKGLTVTGMLDVPIVTPDNKCFAILELYRRNGDKFNQKHLDLINTVGRCVAAALDHNKNRIYLQIQQQIEAYLLEMVQYYFGNLTKLHNLMWDIVQFAKESLKSLRGGYFALECGKLSTDAIVTNTDQCIAEFTLNFKELVNIQDAYTDSRFARENDINVRYITRSAICAPVFDHNNKILGILLIVNKCQGFYTDFDEHIFQIFVKYSTIAMEFTTRYRKSLRSEKWKLIYEDLLFYRTISLRKYEPRIDQALNITDVPKDLYEFSFYPSDDDDLVSLSCCLLKTIKMTKSQLVKFVSSVHNSYRQLPYHNFEHAFNVLHSVACILERNSDKFSYLEKTAFLIATICHDVDHRGFTNHFLEMSDNPFVALYDESPMENHHFFITKMLLCNSPLSATMASKDYKTLINLIQEIILATDLTHHLEDRGQLTKLCIQIRLKGVDIWYNNDEYRPLVRRLMITAGDLSGQSKSFSIAQRLVKNIMLEFYEEAEHLKEIGCVLPRTMDINFIEEIPQFQVQFIEVICLPCFDFLQVVLPNTNNLYYSSNALLKNWQEVVKIRAAKKNKAKDV